MQFLAIELHVLMNRNQREKMFVKFGARDVSVHVAFAPAVKIACILTVVKKKLTGH